MTVPQKPTSPHSPQPDADDQANVVNPINMARARHASAHGSSVLDKSHLISTPPSTASSTPPAQRPQSGPTPAQTRRASQGRSFHLAGLNGCILLLLLGLVFLLGGVLGGIVGGGMLDLSATASHQEHQIIDICPCWANLE